MATASVSYTFVNGDPNDGPQVSQNFTDLVTFLNNSVVHKDGSTTMTGALVLPASDPVSANQATRKSYVDSQLVATVPIGTLMQYAGATAPNSSWLMCDGAAVNRTTYATLFGLVGTTYGVGDGSTTFNLPDLRGRVPVGVGTGTGLTTRALGAKGGQEAPSNPALTHTMDGDGGSRYTVTGGSTFAVVHQNMPIGAGQPYQNVTFSDVDPHSASGTNLPPFVVVNFIIRVL